MSQQDLNNDRLIEPDELLARLTVGNLLIVDLSSTENYMAGHIEGAVHVTPNEIVLGLPPAPGKLPSVERLTELLNRIGYSPEREVIAVDDEGGGWAGRFLWTLEIINHRSWRYLNGGMIAWKRENKPLSVDVPPVPPGDNSLDLNLNPLIDMNGIKKALQDRSSQFWDARSADEYLGLRSGSMRSGRIPGAKHLEWISLMDPERNYRIRSDASELIARAGINLEEPVATYCQTHHRSGFTWLVATLLNARNIKAYDGSWSEWGNQVDTPIEA